MIIRRIRIDGWRALQTGVEIDSIDPRLNVIHAPNGTGKSTLLEALRRGLLDSHRARGEGVEQLRPWGAKLAPMVSIDFAHGGSEYRLRKRFLEEALAELSLGDDTDYQPIANGDDATQRIREMLRAEAPRSLGDWRHAGLAQLLWAPQAGMALTALAPAVVAEIQERLGVQLQQADAPWEERLQNEYSRHFTETGRVRSGRSAPPHVQAEKRLEELRTRKAELEAAWQEFHATSADIEKLRERRTQLEDEQRAREEQLRAARAAVGQVVELRRCHAECAARAGATRRDYDQAQQLDVARQRLTTRQQTAETLRARAVEREDVLRRQLEESTAALREAEREVETRRAAARSAETDAERWALAERYLALREEQRTLAARLERVRDAEQALARVEEAARDVAAPTDEELTQVRRALAARSRAEAQLEMASLHVTLEPERDGRIQVAGEPTSRDVKAGHTLDLQAPGELQLIWEGIGRLEIRGPTDAVQEARAAWNRADAELKHWQTRLGTIDCDQLAQRQREVALRTAALSHARSQLQAGLEGRTRDAWEQAEARCSAAIAEAHAREPAWASALPDVPGLRARAEAATAARRTWEDAQSLRDRRSQQLHELQRGVQAAAAEKGQAEQELFAVVQELQRLAPSDPASEAARLRELAMAAHLAEAQVEAAQRALDVLPTNPAREVERLEAEQAAQTRLREQNLTELSSAEERLRLRSSQSPYAELAAVEEEIAELEHEVEIGRREAAALRLLYDTYHECRRDFSQHVSTAVEVAARRNLGEIFGRDFGTLHVDDSLAPQAIGPEALRSSDEDRVPIDRLSGGEQEQVHFAVRLALAESLAGDERQVLVFDDALTATDPQRMARILRMLEAASERMQIVILTCHPERYRPLRGARWIDLEAARREGSRREPHLAGDRLARTPG